MASKVNLLGQRLRGAQFEVSDLRGNIDRLLQDLEDAVFIFNRERRLVFASGSVEKFLGTERADLDGRNRSADIFPPNATLGLLIAQAARDRAAGAQPARARAPLADAGTGPVAVVLLSRGSAGNTSRAAQARDRACWCGCAIRKRSAKSAANCRRPTAWPPSAAFPAAWPTK